MNRRGQVLIGVILMMVILALIVPAMVLWTQNEARWNVKGKQNMNAFQLAEAAIDRGFRKVSESTTTWFNGQNGTFPANYRGDFAYTDLAGGRYAIALSSGPGSKQATVIGYGQEDARKEVRVIKAVYVNSPMGSAALQTPSSLTFTAKGTSVEWGSIISGQALDVSQLSDYAHPRMYSASSINPFKTSNAAPTTDQIQWWAYQQNLAPFPSIDVSSFSASAARHTGCPQDAGDGAVCVGGVPSGNTTCCWYQGPQTWGNGKGDADVCTTTTACDTGNVYFVNGDLNIDNAIYVRGALIVTGNLVMPSGNGGEAKPTVTVPQQAWREYGNNWSHYSTTWDPTKPATFPGHSNSTYLVNNGAAQTVTGGDTMINGFLYVGGTMSGGNGAGNTSIYGGAYVQGAISLNSGNFTIWYTDYGASMVRASSIVLSRVSWQDLPGVGFPSGL